MNERNSKASDYATLHLIFFIWHRLIKQFTIESKTSRFKATHNDNTGACIQAHVAKQKGKLSQFNKPSYC